MRTQILVCKDSAIFIALVIASYAISVFLFILLEPAPFANVLGFLALLCYAATILPSIAKTIFPETKKQPILKWLFKNRRYTGVAAFCFAWNHGVLLILERNLNLLDYHTYIHYFQGFSAIIIFTVLAITSNDYSVKSLKQN